MTDSPSDARPSELCSSNRHAACDACACRCHTDAAVFDDLALYAGRYAVPPLASRDLLAHLQSGPEPLDLAHAARVVKYVIDLGWRPITREATT
jgi:hypothetical protein